VLVAVGVVTVSVGVGVVGTSVVDGVSVAATVPVGTPVAVSVGVAVTVSVMVAAAVPVGVAVLVGVSVAVGVSGGTVLVAVGAVAVAVDVGEAAIVAVLVTVRVTVDVAVAVAVCVRVTVVVAVRVAVRVDVEVGRLAGHPSSALFTPLMSWGISTLPSEFSNAGQAVTGFSPSTMFTPSTKSVIVTTPLSSQSPTQVCARAGETITANTARTPAIEDVVVITIPPRLPAGRDCIVGPACASPFCPELLAHLSMLHHDQDAI
jgi:hypothetical protein